MMDPLQLSLHSDPPPPSDVPGPQLHSAYHESFRSGVVRAPLARQEDDELSNVSSQHDTPLKQPVPSTPPQHDTPLKQPVPSTPPQHDTPLKQAVPSTVPQGDELGAEGGHGDIGDTVLREMLPAQCLQPESRPVSSIKQWQSVPSLDVRTRLSMEVMYEPTSLQRRPHHDSGLSEFSILSDRRSNAASDRRRLIASTSDVSRMSVGAATEDIIIMHTETDCQLARSFKKTVQKACKRKKVHVETWDERCTGGISAKHVKDELFNSYAVLFFLVTDSFLGGYHNTPYTNTVTGVMYEILEATRNSRCHLAVPVKKQFGEPSEERVGAVFPHIKCLKLNDSNLRKEICKSVETGGVANKRKWWQSSSSMNSATSLMAANVFPELL